MDRTPQPRPNRWLGENARAYSSQNGEDGIIERVLEVLPTRDAWCVEFGAWDGVHLSNTHYFIAQKQYSAVLIEADSVRFQTLRANFQNNPRVHAFNQFVGFGPADGLDAVLSRTPIPMEFDLLSVDIDGNDYHVWAATSRYRPRVVVIEYNPTIADPVEFIQAARPELSYGSSILSICNLARQKGYELVSTTVCNAIFVDVRYFPLFGIRDNSIAELRTDRSPVTYLIQGQDGTFLTSGQGCLNWHRVHFHPDTFQVLPPVLRKYPDNYSAKERHLFHLYRELYHRLLQRDPTALPLLRTIGEPARQIALDPQEAALWTAIGTTLREIQNGQ